MPSLPYRFQSPSGPSEEDEEGSGSSHTAKRRRTEVSSPLYPIDQPEAGPSRRRLAPRRIPSDTPSDGRRSRSSESDDEGRRSGSTRSGDQVDEGYSISSSSDWTYELVVVQHPQRARACGFGDKDRRPLSPPPILRLYIRNSSGHLVDASEVPTHFFLVTVDLWSADSAYERNVVMHPATSTRQPSPLPSIPPPAAAEQQTEYRPPSRPTTADSRPPTSHYPTTGWGWSDPQSPRATAGKSTGPSPHTRIAGSTVIQDHLPVPTSPNFPSQRPASSPTPGHTYPSALQPIPISQRPYTAPAETLRPLQPDNAARRGSFNLPSLASITENLLPDHPPYITLNPIRDFSARPISRGASASTGRPSASSEWTRSSLRPSTTESSQPSTDWTRSSLRPSTTESSQPTTDYSFGRSSTSTWYTSSFSSEGPREYPQVTGWPPPRPSTSGQSWGGAPPAISSPHFDPLPLRPSTSAQPWAPAALRDSLPSRPYSSGQSRPSSAPRPPPSAAPNLAPTPETAAEADVEADDSRYNANFSRVLVGSMCAICQRLTDEDGQDGLFFFTHDLAVRTEGVFRLKFSLSNLEPLLQGGRSTSEGTAVLAQVYSDPFTVYSAKKFPGVVPTTKLTSHFAAQNIRLPTRQRRGGAGGAAQEGEGDEED